MRSATGRRAQVLEVDATNTVERPSARPTTCSRRHVRF
jgi:hypothetical protein